VKQKTKIVLSQVSLFGFEKIKADERILNIDSYTAYTEPIQKLQSLNLATKLEYDGEAGNIKFAYDNSERVCCIAVNSPHMVYCKVIFVDTTVRFASGFKIANLIKPDDSPPAVSRTGKTSLTISSLEWTHNDAFVVILFSTGALAVLPRLASSFLKMYNPTVQNIGGNDMLREQYEKPRWFNEVIMKEKPSV
jgi:hypothetical protein